MGHQNSKVTQKYGSDDVQTSYSRKGESNHHGNGVNTQGYYYIVVYCLKKNKTQQIHVQVEFEGIFVHKQTCRYHTLIIRTAQILYSNYQNRPDAILLLSEQIRYHTLIIRTAQIPYFNYQNSSDTILYQNRPDAILLFI